MRKVVISLVVGVALSASAPAALASTPRADTYVQVWCTTPDTPPGGDPIQAESVDAHATQPNLTDRASRSSREADEWDPCSSREGERHETTIRDGGDIARHLRIGDRRDRHLRGIRGSRADQGELVVECRPSERGGCADHPVFRVGV